MPLDVQVMIVAVDSPIEEVYFYFTRFFTSQLMVAFLFCFCYTLLGLKRLFRYWRVMRERSEDMKEPPLALVGKRVALVSRFFMYAIVRASFCQKLLDRFSSNRYFVSTILDYIL